MQGNSKNQLDAVWVQSDSITYPLPGILQITDFLGPVQVAQVKSFLRTVAPDPQSPVRKDILDQYIYESCGKVYDNLDSVIIDIAAYKSGEELSALYDTVINQPYSMVDFENPKHVTNYFVECILNGSLVCYKEITRTLFDLKTKRTKTTVFASAVQGPDGIWYSENPHVYNIRELEKRCQKILGERDMYNRLKNSPYELLVLTRKSRIGSSFSVPRVITAEFTVDTDNDYVNRNGTNELDEEQSVYIRRIYDNVESGGDLQIFDFKGRFVGDVPGNVSLWLAPAIDMGLLTISRSQVLKLELDGKTHRTLSYTVRVKAVVLAKEDTAAYISHFFIRNFEYPDERTLYFTKRYGLPHTEWLEPILSMYRAYQEYPERLALTPDMQRIWSNAVQSGVIKEVPNGDMLPARNDFPLPADIDMPNLNTNAIDHYTKILADKSLNLLNEDRARALILRAEALLHNGYTQDAFEDYAEAERLLVQNHRLDLIYLAYAYIGQAKINSALGAHDISAAQLGKAASVLEGERARGRESVLKVLIPVYLLGAGECEILGDFTLAADALNCAGDIIFNYFRDSRFVGETTGSIYRRLGFAFTRIGKYDKAFEAYVKSAEIFETLIIRRQCENLREAIDVYRGRAELLKAMGFADLSIHDKKRAVQISSLVQRKAMSDALKRAGKSGTGMPKLSADDLALPPQGKSSGNSLSDTTGGFDFN